MYLEIDPDDIGQLPKPREPQCHARHDNRVMRVLCLVSAPTLGAGNRVRVEQYASILRRDGIELTISAYFDDRTYRILYRPGHSAKKVAGVLRGALRRVRDLFRATSFDLVLVYRESAPLGPPLFERCLRALGRPYVYDFDDAIFLGPIHPANHRWAWLRAPDRVRESVSGAVAVIAGNEYLADWARHWNPEVTVIPSSVDTERHVPGPKSGGPVVIGWVGSTTTAPYLRELDRPLADVTRNHPDTLLRVIGGPYSHPVMPVEVRPYELMSEPGDIAEFSIGVLPEPDDAWTRGKGAFKGLLYMAAGVPVVASRVGVNEEVIGDGGICVDGPAEWVDALERLINDPDLRGRLGAAGRKRVIDRYSVAVQAPRIAAVLRKAVDHAS